MRKALLYASIGLTILMLFTANSVQAAGYATGYVPGWTEAMDPYNITGSPNNIVGSLGLSGNYTGRIMVIISNEFEAGPGDDIIVYGYDVDGDVEQYAVNFGRYDHDVPTFISEDPIGFANDTDYTVGFEIGPRSGSFNMVYLFAINGTGNGYYFGPEIDAVYGAH